MKLNLPKALKREGHSYFTISWNEVREVVKEALENNGIVNGVSGRNAKKISSHTVGTTSWEGYTTSQLLRWVTTGFETEILDGLSDVAPIREKRRFRYVEEGEEIHIDRALSGEDNYMSEWTKRVSIPGAAVEAQVMFSASTKAAIVNAYNVWLCRAISSLESAGIDVQLTMKFSSKGVFPGSGDGHTIVKVKGENEDLDFQSFSAMLSPACLRTFGFVAMCLHAESAGERASGGLGMGHHHLPKQKWEVVYNAKRGTLEINCPYMPRDFPSGEMDRSLKAAIAEMR